LRKPYNLSAGFEGDGASKQIVKSSSIHPARAEPNDVTTITD
jgi:hypothetical protein